MPDQDEDNVLYLSQEEYDWLIAELEKPATVDPKLAALLNEPSVFDKEFTVDD